MLTATFKTTPAFDAGIRGLIQKCRLNSRVVVLKETGELIKTLVRLSPPKNPGKTRANIQESVNYKFTKAAEGGGRDFESTSGSVGASGIKWYSIDSSFLRGVLPQSDMRKASADALYKSYYTLSRAGRQILEFKHPRRRQRVMISGKLLAKPSTIKKVIKRIQDHVGRLKAGWLVAAFAGPIQLTGANTPPQWVTRHSSGARGRFVDGTANQDKPTFLIANSAEGIGGKKTNVAWIVQAAVKIRAKAMAANALLFCKGRKKISDYA